MKSPEELRGKDQIVVDKGDAEELLPGWTKEVKIRKIGSRTKTDRYYTDPITGYTFRSFKDVQRYLKTGEVGKLATKPKPNGQKDGICLSESKEQIMVPSPVSETSRHKRPLEFGSEGYKTRSKSSETSKFESPQRASKRLAGVDAPPLTPSEPKTRQATKLGGIKVEPFDAPPLTPSEPKTRQATKLAGIKVEPFHAPPLTLSEPKTRQATQLAGIKIDGSPPSLPEPKTRQARRLAGMEIDASPPPSLPEPKPRSARRLIGMETDAPPPPPSSPEPKTRQAAQLAGTEIGAPSPPEPKTCQATRLAGTEVVAPPPPPPEPKTRQATRLAGTEISAPSSPEPKTHQVTRLAGTEVGAPPLPPTERKTRQATRLAELETLPEPKTRKATRLAGIRIDASPPPLPEPKTRKATRLAGMKTDSAPEPRTGRQDTVRRAREAETKTSVKLGTPKENDKIKIAESEKTTSGEMQIDCVRKIAEKHDGNASMDDNLPNRKQEIPILSPPTTQESHENIKNDVIKPDEKQKFVFSPKEHHKVIEMGPPALPPVSHTYTTPKEQAPRLNLGIIQTDDDKRHGKQELPVVNPSVSNPIQQPDAKKPESSSSSSMNFCLNDFWTDPCIEFAVKTLTGAIPFGDLNKSDNFAATPLEVPLEELWTDPCIEFAVKTLTGAIPVGEEDYLQRQPSSSSRSENRTIQSFTLPDVGMNFCQTEVLSKHFETVHNKQQQQQKQQDSVGNGVLQKPSVGQGSHSSNINGQCSRGRLF